MGDIAMTPDEPCFPFLLLPLELREQIYRDLLPDEPDICLGPGWTKCEQYDGDKNVEWAEEALRLRFDDTISDPTILRVNHQIYAEASWLLYARTFTITVSAQNINFLHYKHVPRHNRKCYLTKHTRSFPFHRIKALRIQINPPPTILEPVVLGRLSRALATSQSWHSLYQNIQHFILNFEGVTNRCLIIPKLIIDTSKFEDLQQPVNYGTISNREFYHVLTFLSMWTTRVKECSIKLPEWAKNCPETIAHARWCGQSILRRPGGVTSRKKRRLGSSPPEQTRRAMEPIITVDERWIGAKNEDGSITTWGVRQLVL